MPRIIGMMFATALLFSGALGTEAAVAKTPSVSCGEPNARPGTVGTATLDATTLCLVNQLRGADHLRPLRANRQLQAVATRQLRCLVHWGYFADDCPYWLTPGARIAASAYAAHAAALSIGQNLGWGTGPLTTPAQMVAAWMASPPHREIILTGEFLEAGVGVTPTVPSALGVGEEGATYAMEFAMRQF